MRYLKILASAMAFLLFLAASASAQKIPPKLEVFAEGSGSFLTGGTGVITLASPFVCITGIGCPTPLPTTLTSSFSRTGRLVAGARLRFTRHDALEASYSFSPNHLTLQGTEVISDPLTGLVGSIPLSGSSFNRVNLVSFNYVRYLWTRTPVQPFVTVGLGFIRFSGPSNASAVIAGLIGASNGFQFAWNFGGGTDIVLRRHFALRLELRDYLAGQPSPITGTSNNIAPSAGIVYRFM
jgi:opacity protein-like surface antigen